MKNTSFYTEKLAEDAASAMIKTKAELAAKYRANGGRKAYIAKRNSEIDAMPLRAFLSIGVTTEMISGKRVGKRVYILSSKRRAQEIGEPLGKFDSMGDAETAAKSAGLELVK